MHKNQDANQCKLAMLYQIGLEYKKIEDSVYQLINGNRIMIKYSKFYEEKYYWFGIPKLKVEKSLPAGKSFILLLLLCNTKREQDVIVLPATYLLKFLEDIETASDGSWKPKIYPIKDDAGFKISANDKEEEVSDYLNRFDLILDGSANSKEQELKDNYSAIGQDAFAEEFFEGDKYYEGAIKQIKINRYERDLAARNKCIAHYGLSCYICGFKFEDKYGSIGKGFIHIHHLKPLSEIGYEYELDPIQDLRPVCPNCHAIIHRRRPPYSIEEILKFLTRSQ